MIKRISLLGAAAGIAASLLGAPAMAATDGLAISDLIAGGTGCPKTGPYQVSAHLLGDNLVVDFPAFDVLAGTVYSNNDGTGTFRTTARGNCAVSIKVTPPAGFAFAATDVTSRGYATLATGANASAIATVNLAGDDATGTARTDLKGPFYNSFTLAGKIDEPRYSKCGEATRMTVDTMAAINHGTAEKSATSWVENGGRDDKLVSVKLGLKAC